MDATPKSSPNKEIEIFTYYHTPFRMGAPAWTPMKTTARVIASHTVRGIKICTLKSPLTSTYHIADRSSGALVGIGRTAEEALYDVITDIECADAAVMEEQIERGKAECARAERTEPGVFWERLARARP